MDDGGEPGTMVQEVGSKTNPQAGMLELNPASRITLQPDTTYWLVFDLDDMPAAVNTTAQLSLASSWSEDWTPETGWGIGDGYAFRDSAEDWLTATLVAGVPVSLSIAILGTRSCGTTSVEDTSAEVDIPDTALRRVIETALGKSSGDAITYAELATVEEIEAPNSEIASMVGLQYAFGLRVLRLSNNRISSPIDFCGLTSLERLHLSDNDIGGRVDLTGLRLLESVWLDNNKISSIAVPASKRLRTFTAFNNPNDYITWNGKARPAKADYPKLTVYNVNGYLEEPE